MRVSPGAMEASWSTQRLAAEDWQGVRLPLTRHRMSWERWESHSDSDCLNQQRVSSMQIGSLRAFLLLL